MKLVSCLPGGWNEERKKEKSQHCFFEAYTYRFHVSNVVKENYRSRLNSRRREDEEVERWSFKLSFLMFKNVRLGFSDTYIVSPNDFVGRRICFDYAFKVDIISFFDVIRIQARAHLERYWRGICKKDYHLIDSD